MSWLSPPLGTVLLAVGMLSAVSATRQCSVICQGDVECSLKLSPFNEAACAEVGGSYRPRSSGLHLKIKRLEDHAEITWSADRQPHGSVLLTLSEGVNDIVCYNVTYSPKKKQTHHRGTVSCDVSDDIDARLRLYDVENSWRLAQRHFRNKNRKLDEAEKTTKPRRGRHICQCWNPSSVVLVPHQAEKAITVQWSPLYKENDLKVGLVHSDNTEDFVNNLHVIVSSIDLNFKDVTEFRFNNVSAGNYIGLVGAFGCSSCMRYKESHAINFRSNYVTTTPSIMVDIVNTKAPVIVVNPALIQRTEIIVLISLLGLVAICAIGCIFFLVARKQLVKTTKLRNVQAVSVVMETRDAERIGPIIKTSIEKAGKRADLNPNTSVGQHRYGLCLQVSIQQPHPLQHPPAPAADHVLTVSVRPDYEECNEHPLIVHLPPNCRFTDLPNNVRSGDELLSYKDLLKALKKQYVKEDSLVHVLQDLEADVLHVLQERKDAVKNVLLAVCGDNRDHEDLGAALGQLIKLLGKNVVVTNENNMGRNEDLRDWVKYHFHRCDVVVILVSEQMSKLPQQGQPTHNCSYACKCILQELHNPKQEHKRVVVVSLGYWTEHSEKICTQLHASEYYELVDAKAEDLEMNLEGFFHMLCSDNLKTERACTAGQELIPEKVTRVRAREMNRGSDDSLTCDSSSVDTASACHRPVYLAIRETAAVAEEDEELPVTTPLTQHTFA